MNGEWEGAGTGNGKMVEIKFKIYPDGRVEETVVGAKGLACN